jgi:hypothetical protein
MFQFSSIKKNIDSIVAAVAGFIIIFLFTRHGGIGVWPDSVVYLTTAENLHVNGKLVDFAQNAVVEFPAFYPFLLNALILITGLKPLVFAPVLNAMLFALIIYLSGNIIEQYSRHSKWYKIAILSCIVLSPGLLEIYSMLCSETLFLLWLLLFMMAMHHYFRSHNRKALIAAAVIASLVSVTRYAGITIIGTGGILLLLNMNLPLRRKLQDIILYSAISPLLLIINLARNYTISGTMTGNRERSLTTVYENLHNVGSVLYDWLPFLNGHYNGVEWLVKFLILTLAFVCIKQFLKYHCLITYENMAAVFSLLYILFMVVTASITRFETLTSRFLSPVFIPLIMWGSNWIVSSSRRISHTQRKWLVAFGAIFFLSFQYGQLAADYETWDGVKDAGIPGYTEDQWKYSETVIFIQKDSIPFKKGYTIYSDANDAIYFFTRRQGNSLPHKESYSQLMQFLNDRYCYVVWFNDGEDPDLVGLDYITKIKKMKLFKQFSDGAIYEYDSKSVIGR